METVPIHVFPRWAWQRVPLQAGLHSLFWLILDPVIQQWGRCRPQLKEVPRHLGGVSRFTLSCHDESKIVCKVGGVGSFSFSEVTVVGRWLCVLQAICHSRTGEWTGPFWKNLAQLPSPAACHCLSFIQGGSEMEGLSQVWGSGPPCLLCPPEVTGAWLWASVCVVDCGFAGPSGSWVMGEWENLAMQGKNQTKAFAGKRRKEKPLGRVCLA